MQAFSVRELKNNPSAALRAAREHPVMVLSRNNPEALLVHLDDDSILAAPGVRRALALALYGEGCLSLGHAARFSSLPTAEFIETASRLGIPVVHGSHESVTKDVGAITAWRKDS